jgi:hypothetical protein
MFLTSFFQAPSPVPANLLSQQASKTSSASEIFSSSATARSCSQLLIMSRAPHGLWSVGSLARLSLFAIKKTLFVVWHVRTTSDLYLPPIKPQLAVNLTAISKSTNRVSSYPHLATRSTSLGVTILTLKILTQHFRCSERRSSTDEEAA